MTRKSRQNSTPLASIRVARGLTQEAAAKALGISTRHLVRLERGHTRLSWNRLVPMAELYRVSLARLAKVAGLEKQRAA